MKRMLLFVVLGLALPEVVRAQVLTGSVLGIVRDESGAVLPGAAVTLSSQEAAGVTATTNENGEYRFTQVLPGTYSLAVSLTGFSGYQERGLRVLVSGTVERNVMLKLATVAESITVSGESPMVDLRKVGFTANIPNEVLTNLPSLRFGYYEYVKWAPGVSPSDPGGTSGDSSVLGSAPGENIFYYEGVNGNTPASGTSYSGGLNNAVEEVQISTLGASAEYQVAQGAVFNAVLKSGTNVYKGDVTSWFYPDSLISKPIKVNCNCPLGSTGYTLTRRLDYSATAGGPLKKDRLFFFAAWIYTNRKERNPGVDPTLPYAAWNDAIVGKITYRVSRNVNFQGMFQAKPWYLPGTPTVAQPYQATQLTGGNNLMYSEEVTATLSPTTLFTARVGGWVGKGPSGTNYIAPLDGDYTTPYRVDERTGVACCGVQNVGKNPLGTHSQIAKLNTFIKGGRLTQDVRFGVQFAEMSETDSRSLPSGVNYADLNGQPDQATFRSPYVSGADSHSWGLWGEDQIVTGRLTINLGVRYDQMSAISPNILAINDLLQQTGAIVKGLGHMFTWKSAAPRLGFNYKVSDDGKTAVRANYGRASRVIFLNDFNLVHPGLSPVTLARWNPATSSYSTIISVTDSKANLRVDPNSTAPYTDSYSVGFDRELAPSLAVGATYVHKYGAKNIGWQDIGGVYGTQTVALSTGQTLTVYPLLGPTSSRIFLRTNGPGTFTRYNGLVLTLDKRLSHRWQANLSYTRSRAEGLVTTQQDLNGNINAGGLLSMDRPNMFVAEASYQLPKLDAMVSTNFIAMQGNPYAPQALVALPQGRTLVNIAAADGSYRLPSQELLYFRYVQTLFRRGSQRLELTAELANALQNTAYMSVVSQVLGSATFGQASTWVLPRRLYFATAYRF
jgi:hypothetical protein